MIYRIALKTHIQRNSTFFIYIVCRGPVTPVDIPMEILRRFKIFESQCCKEISLKSVKMLYYIFHKKNVNVIRVHCTDCVHWTIPENAFGTQENKIYIQIYMWNVEACWRRPMHFNRTPAAQSSTWWLTACGFAEH